MAWEIFVVVLEPSCALLGRSWAALGALLGRSCDALGTSLAWSWGAFSRYWPSQSDLGAISVDLGAILAHSNHTFIVLGSIFAALATVRIELSPAWELHFHAFALWRFITFRKHDFLAYFA